MAAIRTAKQKAALRKAQLASAKKRRRSGGPSNKRKIAKRVAKGAAVGAVVGAAAYGAHHHKNAIKKNLGNARKNAERKVRHKAENNNRVRQAVAKDLLAKRRASTKKPAKGLKLAKKYRMGRADVRKRRKANRG